jgi:ubiquinone/menaquinone biosynthesis C-methylase UbiE
MVLSCSLIILIWSSCVRTGRWSEEWEEKFETFQPSEIIMDAMEIRPGMVIGEIGAGNGRFAVKVADRIGMGGKVYANDIDPRALNFMRRRCMREHINNMFIVKGEAADPHFPEGTLDLVYIINTYHEITHPVALMNNTVSALKHEGRLVIVEIDPKKLEEPHSHSTPEGVVVSQAEKAGYDLLKIETFLPIDNIYIFQARHDEED